MAKYVCVDFDGTIVDHRYPGIGRAVPGALDTLKNLNRLDIRVILWTMRSGGKLKEAVDFLKSHKVKLHGINENPTQHFWTTSPKAYGHLYIDDAAVGCPLTQPKTFKNPCVDWRYVRDELETRLDIKLDIPKEEEMLLPNEKVFKVFDTSTGLYLTMGRHSRKTFWKTKGAAVLAIRNHVIQYQTIKADYEALEIHAFTLQKADTLMYRETINTWE